MLNKAILIGHVGQPPEIRTNQAGDKFATFSLATSRRWKDKESGEKKEKTTWHRVVIFNKNLAEIVEKYVDKGSKIYIEGELNTRKWTDEGGADRYQTEIMIQMRGTLVLLDKSDSSTSAPPDSAYEEE